MAIEKISICGAGTPNQINVRAAAKARFPDADITVLPKMLIPRDLDEHIEVVLVSVDDVIIGRGEIDGSTPETMYASLGKVVAVPTRLNIDVCAS